ncbi:hypothetical protein DFS34DRAFT_688313 [Phlyctochytrium arcticum]|nr:hypothetical protein DFS34DRAFT_688313 [Phlyctochytrium arcticum]
MYQESGRTAFFTNDTPQFLPGIILDNVKNAAFGSYPFLSNYRTVRRITMPGQSGVTSLRKGATSQALSGPSIPQISSAQQQQEVATEKSTTKPVSTVTSPSRLPKNAVSQSNNQKSPNFSASSLAPACLHPKPPNEPTIDSHYVQKGEDSYFPLSSMIESLSDITLTFRKENKIMVARQYQNEIMMVPYGSTLDDYDPNLVAYLFKKQPRAPTSRPLKAMDMFFEAHPEWKNPADVSQNVLSEDDYEQLQASKNVLLKLITRLEHKNLPNASPLTLAEVRERELDMHK